MKMRRAVSLLLFLRGVATVAGNNASNASTTETTETPSQTSTEAVTSTAEVSTAAVTAEPSTTAVANGTGLGEASTAEPSTTAAVGSNATEEVTTTPAQTQSEGNATDEITSTVASESTTDGSGLETTTGWNFTEGVATVSTTVAAEETTTVNATEPLSSLSVAESTTVAANATEELSSVTTTVAETTAGNVTEKADTTTEATAAETTTQKVNATEESVTTAGLSNATESTAQPQMTTTIEEATSTTTPLSTAVSEDSTTTTASQLETTTVVGSTESATTTARVEETSTEPVETTTTTEEVTSTTTEEPTTTAAPEEPTTTNPPEELTTTAEKVDDVQTTAAPQTTTAAAVTTTATQQPQTAATTTAVITTGGVSAVTESKIDSPAEKADEDPRPQSTSTVSGKFSLPLAADQPSVQSKTQEGNSYCDSPIVKFAAVYAVATRAKIEKRSDVAVGLECGRRRRRSLQDDQDTANSIGVSWTVTLRATEKWALANLENNIMNALDPKLDANLGTTLQTFVTDGAKIAMTTSDVSTLKEIFGSREPGQVAIMRDKEQLFTLEKLDSDTPVIQAVVVAERAACEGCASEAVGSSADIGSPDSKTAGTVPPIRETAPPQIIYIVNSVGNSGWSTGGVIVFMLIVLAVLGGGFFCFSYFNNLDERPEWMDRVCCCCFSPQREKRKSRRDSEGPRGRSSRRSDSPGRKSDIQASKTSKLDGHRVSRKSSAGESINRKSVSAKTSEKNHKKYQKLEEQTLQPDEDDTPNLKAGLRSSSETSAAAKERKKPSRREESPKRSALKSVLSVKDKLKVSKTVTVDDESDSIEEFEADMEEILVQKENTLKIMNLNSDASSVVAVPPGRRRPSSLASPDNNSRRRPSSFQDARDNAQRGRRPSSRSPQGRVSMALSLKSVNADEVEGVEGTFPDGSNARNSYMPPHSPLGAGGWGGQTSVRGEVSLLGGNTGFGGGFGRPTGFADRLMRATRAESERSRVSEWDEGTDEWGAVDHRSTGSELNRSGGQTRKVSSVKRSDRKERSERKDLDKSDRKRKERSSSDNRKRKEETERDSRNEDADKARKKRRDSSRGDSPDSDGKRGRAKREHKEDDENRPVSVMKTTSSGGAYRDFMRKSLSLVKPDRKDEKKKKSSSRDDGRKEKSEPRDKSSKEKSSESKSKERKDRGSSKRRDSTRGEKEKSSTESVDVDDFEWDG